MFDATLKSWPRRNRSVVAKKPAVKLTPRDKKTNESLVGLADRVVSAAKSRRDPYVEIPSRTLANVHYSPRKRIHRDGQRARTGGSSSTSRRPRPTCGRCSWPAAARSSSTRARRTSLRGLFYMLKHTIEGAKENTFDEQDECDTIIEDVEVLLDSIREELHLYAENRGAMVGAITFTDKGDEIDCSRMGSGGYAIPSICEPEVIQFDPASAKPSSSCTSKRTRSGSGSTKTASGRSTTASSPTAAASRRAACGGCCYRLHNELKLPLYCVLDNDPWGYYIYSVHQAGLDQPGVRVAADGDSRSEVPGPAQHRLRALPALRQREDHAQRHRPQAGQADRQYPWFEKKRDWQTEIEKMLKNDFKLEVESLISQGHQLRDRGVRAGAAARAGLAGLSDAGVSSRHRRRRLEQSAQSPAWRPS